MDVKAVTDNLIMFAVLGLVGAVLSTFNAWVKEALEQRRAHRDWKRNPHARVGAKLAKWCDAGGREVMGRCQVWDAKIGRVVLRSTSEVVVDGMPLPNPDATDLVRTIREFQAGHAFWVK